MADEAQKPQAPEEQPVAPAAAVVEPVPNVTPKVNPKEQARIDAQIGNLNKQNGQFVTNERGQERVLEVQGPPKPEEGESMDLKLIPTIYFSGCQDCKYAINHRSAKIFIDGCTNLEITVNEPILTTTIEIWKCSNATLTLNTPVKTLQVDLLQGLTVNWGSNTHMGAIVWQHVEGLKLRFADDEKLNTDTGFEAMKTKFPDSELEIDQFIIRIIEESLWEERCIRLKNGFLSTEREAVEWEKRNDNVKEKYVNDFLKSAGIKLNQEKKQKDPPRNSPCPCGSKKKFKACCFGKKELTGVAEKVNAQLYNKKQ